MITGIPNKRRGVERLAGLTGLFISFFVVAAIFTGLDLKPEFINIHEDLAYLGENLERLRINTWIWFINAILIILFGPLILLSFLPYGRSSAYLAAFLISGIGTHVFSFSAAWVRGIMLTIAYVAGGGGFLSSLLHIPSPLASIKSHFKSSSLFAIIFRPFFAF